jgi:Zn-dependent M28 family amino/carboxypeptidase
MLWILLACHAPETTDSKTDLLSADAIEASTKSMTDLGARLVATPAEDAAREWLVSRFGTLGLVDVSAEPFTYDAWVPGTATVTVDSETRDALPFSPTGSLIEGLTAPLYGPGDAFSGGFVVISSDDGSRGDAFTTATFGGAAGLIRITDQVGHHGQQLVEVGHTLTGAAMPSVSVSQETGNWLLQHLGEPLTLVAQTDWVRDHVSYNVFGTIEGRQADLGPIVVVAHYDSWHTSESAFDNALGIGALVQIAEESLSREQPERDIIFMATSAEEQGVRGAAEWVAANPLLADAVDTVLVLDVVWAMEGAFEVGASAIWLQDIAVDAAAEQGLDATRIPLALNSDHVPFVTRGVGAVYLHRWPDRHYHTEYDTLDQLDLTDASAAIKAQMTILESLAW